ncbi:hypothetical protein [Luteirhabdus pelagi]|uniref:hypothetical protein n=1 Tax=Luteirhabdus pelagi TaxID=2792783 RepID=UPI001939E23A|nr:hypothetical protein [Luteirhabdus pelagi]
MKKDVLKELIKKSELKTRTDFTDSLISKLDAQHPVKKPVTFWSIGNIVIGFAVLAIISGFLVYSSSKAFLSMGGVAIPFIWSFLLLSGMSYLLSINKCKAYLRVEK